MAYRRAHTPHLMAKPGGAPLLGGGAPAMPKSTRTVLREARRLQQHLDETSRREFAEREIAKRIHGLDEDAPL